MQVNILKTIKLKKLEAIGDKFQDNEKQLKYKEVFNELFSEKIVEIYNISKKVNLKNLSYHFKGSDTAPTYFIKFSGPIEGDKKKLNKTK